MVVSPGAFDSSFLLIFEPFWVFCWDNSPLFLFVERLSCPEKAVSGGHSVQFHVRACDSGDWHICRAPFVHFAWRFEFDGLGRLWDHGCLIPEWIGFTGPVHMVSGFAGTNTVCCGA